MSDRVPSQFMLIPGPWRSASQVASALRRARVPCGEDVPDEGIGVRVVEDPDLGNAMAWGGRGPLPDDVVAACAACSHAALVEVEGLLHERRRVFGAVGDALSSAGGVAVRMEGSGSASTWNDWFEAIDGTIPSELLAIALVVSQDDDGVLFTIGMHQFDLPDAEIRADDPQAAAGLLHALCAFQLDERPVLGSGHTFHPDPTSPRRVLERWPDGRFPPDDGRHNPFGLWRMLPPGVPGLPARDPVPVPIPALVALLSAAERRNGRPLTEGEVARIAEECVTMAIPLADVGVFERSRGHADIEPARAWAQWQIARAWG